MDSFLEKYLKITKGKMPEKYDGPEKEVEKFMRDYLFKPAVYEYRYFGFKRFSSNELGIFI